jgi:peptide/nickel transport system ATP-binding protein
MHDPLPATALLEVKHLRVAIRTKRGEVQAVRDVSLSVNNGETLCIVGESGCGKSMTALAIMRLLPPNSELSANVLRFGDLDLLALRDRDLRRLRGDRIAMIFQDPMTALNPSYTVGNQLIEVYRRHRRSGSLDAKNRAVGLLKQVGIANPGARLGQYPHQLSGGLRQRVMIAMALLCEPKLLIADEPTTALDVTIQAQVLRLLADLQKQLGIALILVTHDLGIVACIADRVAVMYAGEIVESGPAREIFSRPLHPYTRSLFECLPVPGQTMRGARLGVIPGNVPSPEASLQGCAFRPRCRYARPECAQPIAWTEASPGHGRRCVLEFLP